MWLTILVVLNGIPERKCANFGGSIITFHTIIVDFPQNGKY